MLGLINQIRDAYRRGQARREFARLTAAYDEAIAAARAKHKPVAGILRAKREFLHERLAHEITAPSAWRGR